MPVEPRLHNCVARMAQHAVVHGSSTGGTPLVVRGSRTGDAMRVHGQCED